MRDERRLVSKSKVLERVDLSWPTVWRMIRKDEFPQPVRAGIKTMFYADEVDDWVETRRRCVFQGQGPVTDANKGAMVKHGGRPKRAEADEKEPKRKRGRPRKAAA